MKIKNLSYKLYEMERNNSRVIDIDKFLDEWNPIKLKGSKKKTISILTFDTETTVDYYVDSNNKKVPVTGFVCMGQFCLDGHLIYCRTVDEIVNFFEKLNKKLDGRKIRCYVHNLGYDFQFIRDSFGEYGHEVSCEKYLGDDRNPIYAEFDGLDITFCCSYKLFDKKLESVAKDYNLPIKKGTGWDYNKFRTTKTMLNAKEIEYGMFDVYLLYLALKKKINICGYKHIWDVPWTKTGEVRYYRKMVVGGQPKYFRNFEKFSEIKENAEDCDKLTDEEFEALDYDNTKKYYRNHYMWEKKTIKGKSKWYKVSILTWDNRYIRTNNAFMEDFETSYRLSEKAFLGGFTHANRIMLGRHLRNVASYDLTSAYPSVMLVKKFVYHWKHKLNSLKDVRFDKNGFIVNKGTGYLLKLRFKKLKALHGISVISSSKVEGLVKPKNNPHWIDNGRILEADEFVFTCYDTDYNIYKKYYTWESVEFIEGFKGTKVRLLDSDFKTILHFYEEKCKWKTEKKRLEDMRDSGDPNFDANELSNVEAFLKFAKQQLNSVYGCAAMDKWKYIKVSETDNEDKAFSDFCKTEQAGSHSTVSTFTIGGQVTSYVREQILTAIAKIGYKDMVYSDTDSIKFLNRKLHEKVFDEINKEMQAELQALIKELDLDTSKWTEPLNKFDYEGEYPDFKTLGAKRYIHTCKEKDSDKLLTIKKAFKGNEATCSRFTNKHINIDNSFIECTTAGCKKEDMLLYLWTGAKNVNEAFNRYSKGVEVTDSKKQTTLYVDSEYATENVNYKIENGEHVYKVRQSKHSYMSTVMICDHKGHLLDTVKVGSYIVLYPATFSMATLAKDVIYSIEANLGLIVK